LRVEGTPREARLSRSKNRPPYSKSVLDNLGKLRHNDYIN
jgi:hypothetical protein